VDSSLPVLVSRLPDRRALTRLVRAALRNEVAHVELAHAPQRADAHTLDQALHHYFAYRARQLGSDIRELLRVGALSLAGGFAILVGCLALRHAMIVGPPVLDRTIAEQGLLILGWVAIWRPAEILLYDWWPLARRLALLRRLQSVPVEVRGTG